MPKVSKNLKVKKVKPTKLTTAQKLNRPPVVSTLDLARFLWRLPYGSKFATIVAVTECKVLKDCPYGEIFKVSKFQSLIQTNYSRAVNNQMKREGVEGEFKAKPRKWGKLIPRLSLVGHKKRLYISCRPLKGKNLGLKYGYIDAGGIFRVLPREEAENWIVEHKKPKSQSMIESEILERCYLLDNIWSITCNKTKLKIR